MSDIALDWSDEALGTDAYGDLKLSASGDLQLTSGIEAIEQALQLRLRAASGDYFMASNDGIAWIEMFSSGEGYTPAFDAVLKNQVLETPGISSILAWNVDYNRSAKTVMISMEIECLYGVINFSLPVSLEGLST